MKSYLLTIITVSICIGIYNVISPQFRGFEKYSKMIGMLIVLCIIISPVKDFLNFFDDEGLEDIKDGIVNRGDDEESEYDKIFNDYLASYSIEEVKDAIEEGLLEKFQIPNDECEVSISTEYIDGKLTVSYVQILLSGKSIFKNPYTIEDYFSKLLGCTCSVLIK